MKPNIQLAVIIVILVAFISCKNKKNTTTSATSYSTAQPQNNSAATSQTTQSTNQQVNPSGNNSNETNPSASLPKDDKMRFVVSFYSIGEGIDLKTHDAFVKFLDSYSKKIAYEPKHHGREGEVDYCLGLKELTPAEQNEFVSKAKTLLTGSKLVHQKENGNCDNTNWDSAIIPATGDSYRLVVSFYSVSSGIDLKGNEDFEKLLSAYPKKIAYEPTHWGREGEKDYCLKLSELSTAEQADFVKKAKELLSKSTLVHINENSDCVHKH